MASVYTFKRTDNDILENLLRVFNASRGSAKEQWSIQADMLVEPIGWDALWKLSKNFCRRFKVRFPCIAYITVTGVDFDNLSASVEVLNVQHESLTLPESVDDVPLIELWPTEKQREACINVATTAEFIDLMRFFYNDIWMPWDDQDDKILLPNTIEDRMKLWQDLHNGTIPKFAVHAIKLLRSSAISAHEKLQELDMSLSEDVMADDDDADLPPNYIALCAEMNVRLDGLMSRWTLYENPLIREQYLAKLKSNHANRCKKNVVALWEGGSIYEFDGISSYLRARINNEQTLAIMPSADEAFALDPDEVIVCNKTYDIPEMPLSNISLCSFNGSTIKASEMRTCLLMLSETCLVRDLHLRCHLVNTLIVCNGSLHIANCTLYDDTGSQGDFAQGIVANPGAKIVVEDCTFDNFYTGIVVHPGAKLELRNCVIRKCGVGIQMYKGAKVTMTHTTVADCTEQSIRYEADIDEQKNRKNGVQNLEISPNCKIGSGDMQKELFIAQQDMAVIV